jgi:hypothetical protein
MATGRIIVGPDKWKHQRVLLDNQLIVSRWIWIIGIAIPCKGSDIRLRVQKKTPNFGFFNDLQDKLLIVSLINSDKPSPKSVRKKVPLPSVVLERKSRHKGHVHL